MEKGSGKKRDKLIDRHTHTHISVYINSLFWKENGNSDCLLERDSLSLCLYHSLFIHLDFRHTHVLLILKFFLNLVKFYLKFPNNSAMFKFLIQTPFSHNLYFLPTT